jgi:hypothetical protein
LDVSFQGHRVAVIQVQPERFRVELVNEPPARHDLVFRHRAVHFRRVPAVEVDRVRMRSRVDEVDADAVPFGRAERRSGHLPVERPGRKEHPGRDFDFTIDGHQLVLPQQRAVGTSGLLVEPAALSGGQVREVEAPQECRGVEGLGRHAADRAGRVSRMFHGPERLGLAGNAGRAEGGGARGRTKAGQLEE